MSFTIIPVQHARDGSVALSMASVILSRHAIPNPVTSPETTIGEMEASAQDRLASLTAQWIVAGRTMALAIIKAAAADADACGDTTRQAAEYVESLSSENDIDGDDDIHDALPALEQQTLDELEIAVGSLVELVLSEDYELWSAYEKATSDIAASFSEISNVKFAANVIMGAFPSSATPDDGDTSE